MRRDRGSRTSPPPPPRSCPSPPPPPPTASPADRVAVEADGPSAPPRFPRGNPGSSPPCWMPKSDVAGPVAEGLLRPLRPPHRQAHAFGDAVALGRKERGIRRNTSRCRTPAASGSPSTASGLSMCREPSIVGAEGVTPLPPLGSVFLPPPLPPLRRSARLITWNPRPESVRDRLVPVHERVQPAQRGRDPPPPWAAQHQVIGCLPSRISAPLAATLSGSIALTVARRCRPAMKAVCCGYRHRGVEITPRWVGPFPLAAVTVTFKPTDHARGFILACARETPQCDRLPPTCQGGTGQVPSPVLAQAMVRPRAFMHGR